MRDLFPFAFFCLALCLAVPATAQDDEAAQDAELQTETPLDSVVVPPLPMQISVLPEPVVAGDKATLSFGAPVETVVFTYRPNSAIPIVDTVQVGGFESVRWTPEQAGVVRVAVVDGPSRNLSVRFASYPIAGLFVLVAAAMILFGGAGWAMSKLLSGGPPATLPETRPDT